MFTIAFQKMGILLEIKNVLISEPFGWKIEIGWNLLLLFFALLAGLCYGYFLLKKQGGKKIDFFDYILSSLFAGLVGARLGYIIFSGGHSGIHSFLDVLNPFSEGLSLSCGLVAAFFAGFLCCRVKKLSVLPFFDATVLALCPSLLLGYFSDFFSGGGIGTFSAGLLWGVTIDGRGPFHPLFLYHILFSAVSFLLLFLYHKIFQKRDGETFSLAIVLFFAAKAVTINFETDVFFFFGLNLPFILSLIAAAFGLILFFLIRFGFLAAFREKKEEKKQKKQPAYQNIYKPLLDDIPQTYIADQKTIADSLRFSETKELLTDNQKTEKKLDSEDEKDGTDH